MFSKFLIKFKSPTLNNSKEKDEQQEDSGAESDISIEDVEETKHTVPDKIIDSTEIEHDVEETANNIASEVAETNKDNVHVNVENNEEDKETTVAINTTSIDLSQNNISHFKDNLEKVVEKVVEKDELVIVQEESLDKNGIMNEIEILPPSENTDIVKLKNPNEVYMEIYKEARRKAKEAKKHAIQSYLEAKRIKSLYLLDEIESSDDDVEFEEYEG